MYISAEIEDPYSSYEGYDDYRIEIDQYTISPLTKTRFETRFHFSGLTTDDMMKLINALKNPQEWYVSLGRNSVYHFGLNFYDSNLIDITTDGDGLRGYTVNHIEKLALLRIFENLHEMVQRLESEYKSSEREGLAHVTLFTDGSILQTADRWNPV